MKKSTKIIFACFIAGSFCFTSCNGCTKRTGDDGSRVESNSGPGIGDGTPENPDEGDHAYNNSSQSGENEGNGNSATQRSNGNRSSSTSGGSPSSPANQVTPSGSSGTGIFPGKTEGDTSGGNSKNNARTVSPGGKGNSGMGRPY